MLLSFHRFQYLYLFPQKTDSKLTQILDRKIKIELLWKILNHNKILITTYCSHWDLYNWWAKIMWINDPTSITLIISLCFCLLRLAVSVTCSSPLLFCGEIADPSDFLPSLESLFPGGDCRPCPFELTGLGLQQHHGNRKSAIKGARSRCFR